MIYYSSWRFCSISNSFLTEVILQFKSENEIFSDTLFLSWCVINNPLIKTHSRMISLDVFPLWKSLFSDKNTSSWNSSPKTNFFKYFGFILTHLLLELDRLENYTRTVLLVKTRKCWNGVAPSEQSESTTTYNNAAPRERALHNSRKTLENSLHKRQFVSELVLGIQFSCSSLYQENRQNSLHS